MLTETFVTFSFLWWTYNSHDYHIPYHDICIFQLLFIQVMHTAGGKAGRNRFYWPRPIDDILWYKNDHVIAVLDEEPRPVTGRHMEVHPLIWQQVEIQLGL